MTTEMWVIAVARLAGSLPVLRWPFYGALLALLVDQSDLFMMNLLHLGGVDGYQSFDKNLDQVYLLAFLIVALRWDGPERTIAAGLYFYRFAGFVTFEVSQTREVLLFFPNLFEVWFLLVAGRRHFGLPHVWQDRRLAWLTAGLVAGKLFQEYAVHYARWLDGFTAVEAVEAIWHFFIPF